MFKMSWVVSGASLVLRSVLPSGQTYCQHAGWLSIQYVLTADLIVVICVVYIDQHTVWFSRCDADRQRRSIRIRRLL